DAGESGAVDLGADRNLSTGAAVGAAGRTGAAGRVGAGGWRGAAGRTCADGRTRAAGRVGAGGRDRAGVQSDLRAARAGGRCARGRDMLRGVGTLPAAALVA